MDAIKVEITLDKLKEAIEKGVEKVLTDSYGNPVLDAVKEQIKKQDGIIRKVVEEVFTETLHHPDFKAKLGEKMMALMVENALKK